MYSVPSLVQRLKKVSHFKDLPPHALYDIVTAGEVRSYPKGHIIYAEGEPCAGMFVLFRGCIHLCKISPQGQQSIIGVITPVIMFNEVPILDGGCNPVTAMVDETCITWRISKEKFQELAHRYPVLGLSLLSVLASRNRMLLSFCEGVNFRSVMGRTAQILLDLSQHGTITINRRQNPNHVLAARAATVPEPFCRAVSTLRQHGTIECTRAAITVLDPQRLAHIAEVDSAWIG